MVTRESQPTVINWQENLITDPGNRLLAHSDGRIEVIALVDEGELGVVDPRQIVQIPSGSYVTKAGFRTILEEHYTSVLIDAEEWETGQAEQWREGVHNRFDEPLARFEEFLGTVAVRQ